MTVLTRETTDYARFVADMRFSGMSPFDEGIVLLTGHNPPRISTVDATLTQLPFGNAAMKDRLAPVLTAPRMSTFAIGALINRIVSDLPADRAFVNVGVWHGFTLLCGMLGHPDRACVGVDNFSEFGGPKEAFMERFTAHGSDNHRFHELDYRDYFQNHTVPPIGFYIYDGDHSRENQRNGLRAAEPYLTPGAFILVDDFNLDDAIDGTRDFIADSAHQYTVVLEQHTCHDWHPTFWNGVALLRKED